MTIRHTSDDSRQLHGYATARALRALADQAERGEYIGAAVVVWAPEKSADFAVAGVFEMSPHLAYYAVSQLRDVLLYPSEI
jgi:hypothetical protein